MNPSRPRAAGTLTPPAGSRAGKPRKRPGSQPRIAVQQSRTNADARGQRRARLAKVREEAVGGRAARAVDSFAFRWGIISGSLLVLGSLVAIILMGGINTSSAMSVVMDLLLPVAGAVALFATLQMKGKARALTTMGAGIALFAVPFVQVMMADTTGRLAALASASAGPLVVMFGLPLAIAGMAVGAKVREVFTDSAVARMLGGVSGILVIGLLVLPVLPGDSSLLTLSISVVSMSSFFPLVVVVGLAAMAVVSLINFGQLHSTRSLAIAVMAIGLVLMVAVPCGIMLQGSTVSSIIGGKAILIALTAIFVIYGMVSLAPTGIADLLMQSHLTAADGNGPTLTARARIASRDARPASNPARSKPSQAAQPSKSSTPRRRPSSPRTTGNAPAAPAAATPSGARRPGTNRPPRRRPRV